MASRITSIKDFKVGKKGKLYILEVYVFQQSGKDTFLVGDNSDYAVISCKNHSEIMKRIQPKSSIRIVQPSLEDDTIILNHDPLQCSEVEHISEEDVPLDTEVTPDLLTFDQIQEMNVDSTIPSVTSKVIFASPSKKAKFSERQRFVQLKDIKGQKQAITFFGRQSELDKLEKDKVFTFTDLKVQTYQGSKRLGSKPSTSIEAVSSNVSDLFKDISDVDATFTGVICGNEPINFYFSCPQCKKKVNKESGKCESCGLDFFPHEAIQDYNVRIQVQINDDEDPIRKILFFREDLKFSPELTNAEVESKLQDLAFMECVINVKNQEHKNNEYQGLKLVKKE